jgi:MFS family permease
MNSPTVKRYLPWVVATALFMEQLDSTIVNTGIPAMAASLGVTPLSLKAVVTSYILSLAVSIPISGWLAERYGSRCIFMLAVALFTLSSVLCGLAVNSTMMMPVGRMAILRTFPKGELLQAMNFVIIPALLGPLLGPTVGLLALWFAKNYMPNYKSDTPRPLDVRGLLLFASSAGLLSWLLEVFGEIDLPGGTVAMLAAVALGLFNSLQFSSMNSMAYADINDADTAMASTLASTLQQMSMSFGLAFGSLITAYFLGGLPQSDRVAVTSSLHHAFLALAVLTLVSSAAFWTLRPQDGESVSKGSAALV